MQQQWTISQSDCDVQPKVDFIQQPANVQLSGWTEKKLQSTSQNHTCIKNTVMVIVGWSAANLIFYSFLNSSKTIICEKDPQQINEMHQKLQCLQLTLVNRKGPILCHKTPNHMSHKQDFKSWTNWAMKFASSTIFTWLLTNWLPLLQASQQLFAGKTLPQAAGGWKCFLRVHWLLKHRICYRNKQTYFSLAKWVDCNGSYFD